MKSKVDALERLLLFSALKITKGIGFNKPKGLGSFWFNYLNYLFLIFGGRTVFVLVNAAAV